MQRSRRPTRPVAGWRRERTCSTMQRSSEAQPACSMPYQKQWSCMNKQGRAASPNKKRVTAEEQDTGHTTGPQQGPQQAQDQELGPRRSHDGAPRLLAPLVAVL